MSTNPQNLCLDGSLLFNFFMLLHVAI